MDYSKSLMLFLLGYAAFSAIRAVRAMQANPFGSFREVQPDGTMITLRLHGDPHDSWMTDENQYTVLRDPSTKYFVYAQTDKEGGLKPSSVAVKGLDSHDKEIEEHASLYDGIDHSKSPPGAASDSISSEGAEFERESHTSFTNKQKNLRPAIRDCRDKICGSHHEENYIDFIHRHKRSLRSSNSGILDNESVDRRLTAFSTPTRLRNLVLLIRWSDHTERELPTRQEYEVLMNNKGPDRSSCPTGSVRDVFLQNSYGALEVDSYVTDWIPMDNTEEYYANGDKGTTSMIQDAIRYALAYVDHHQLVDFDFFDEDEDGRIDSITFIHSGYGAERGGTDAYGRFFEERIWSHKWQLFQRFRSNWGRNVEVSAYHISSGLWGIEGSNIGRIGVIAHEMAHFLGLPDLYDYDSSSSGLGNYGLMSNSWGSNGQQLHPPHMSAWAKMLLGWVTPVEPKRGINIVEASAELNPSHPQVYIIQEGFPDGEFLLIENRQPMAFDINLPQGGLAIWHIDYGSAETYRMRYVYNRQSQEGHPWQEGWPENGNHYPVALLQADGYYDLERGFNHGDFEDLFHASDVSQLVPCRIKNNCQYPNTDSYRDGRVVTSNVHITDVSDSGQIMTFKYKVEKIGQLTTSPTLSPVTTDNSTPAPTVGDQEPNKRVIGRTLSVVIIVSPILLFLLVGLVVLACLRSP